MYAVTCQGEDEMYFLGISQSNWHRQFADLGRYKH